MADTPVPLAINSDVTGRETDTTRVFSPADVAVIDLLILDASELLRGCIPALDDRLAAGTISSWLVSSAIARIVLRVIEAPGAGVVKNRTDSKGPFSRSLTYSDLAGSLTVLPQDLVGITGGISADENYARIGSARLGTGWTDRCRA